jgi:hypothetical protein
VTQSDPNTERGGDGRRPACACLALVAPNPVLFAVAQAVYETGCIECPTLSRPPPRHTPLFLPQSIDKNQSIGAKP